MLGEAHGLKIALIGAGSFVFGPSVLAQTFGHHRLDAVELALIDVDAEMLERMAGVGRRMARQTGLARARITTHTERNDALDGADFVIHSASPQMQRRHATDREIIAQFSPDHLITEFGGIAGISYSLRQTALVEQIADDMRRLCPNAWLLSVANPLPRVCQTAHERGIRTAGFCSVSLGAYQMLWQLLRGEPIYYPFAAAREAFDITMAGVNHLSWMLAIRDRLSGEDLLPQVRARLEAGGKLGGPQNERLGRETGIPLAIADDHAQDFLAPDGTGRSHTPYHGGPDERARRLALLEAVARGDTPWQSLLEHEAWERPLDFIVALAGGAPIQFGSLNLVNNGQVSNLPRGVFVETSCQASPTGGVVPQTNTLPEPVLPFVLRTVQVTQAIVQAARERSRAQLFEAVDLDPTILDKPGGRAAIEACLLAHADVLPAYH